MLSWKLEDYKRDYLEYEFFLKCYAGFMKSFCPTNLHDQIHDITEPSIYEN
jgi:hypothetical protein